MNEEFLDIPGFQGRYQINKQGDVLSLRRSGAKQHLLPAKTEKGYRRVFLYIGDKSKGFQVHRLVALTFIPNPDEKPFVNHKDGNKRNNTVENLEWCTRAENQKHSREVLGNTGRGAKNSNYGYSYAKLYPSEELRARLVELGIPRNKHNLAELGEMLPEKIDNCHVVITKKTLWNVMYNQIRHTCGKPSQIAWFNENSLANAMANMLIYLKENKII